MAAQRLCSVGKNVIKRQLPRTYPQWKTDLGKEIINVFENNSKVLLLQYNALNSDEWQDLRYDMRKENAKVKVYPNKITCKFLSDTVYSNLTILFRSETCIAYGDGMNLKNIVRILNTNPKTELIGAKIDNTLMNKQQIVDYSKLPSLDQCRSELVQILSQPSKKLSQLLQTNQSYLSMSLAQYMKQLEES
ncbi:39S ribosomal protein L10, mitochondrial-like [Hydractinia symbiolongicarpus]|uniref:39S ribosomal protein L10, mitochondrial-like n=1 Tax=Hydractinia symbiolongicarpus TaxID=13093 RepID=UPI00254A5480|nr:39S ribosomal protein L10, mitochondrial-like [Hydractinia symbiolongicarpus]XP_057303805.1 39S ribosomal protein L10, mitochondrial-like [Hydractinia symbiolongicarpus]